MIKLTKEAIKKMVEEIKVTMIANKTLELSIFKDTDYNDEDLLIHIFAEKDEYSIADDAHLDFELLHRFYKEGQVSITDMLGLAVGDYERAIDDEKEGFDYFMGASALSHNTKYGVSTKLKHPFKKIEHIGNAIIVTDKYDLVKMITYGGRDMKGFPIFIYYRMSGDNVYRQTLVHKVLGLDLSPIVID